MGNVILTSCHPRHNYFVNVVERICDVSLVVQEDKPGLTGEACHTEKKYFSNGNKILSEVIRCEKGRLNSFQITEQIKDQKPDIIFVFGSGIIGSKIIEIPRLGCINVHTGITQHFRGVDSCFWAVHDDKPQGIGATLHFNLGNIDYISPKDDDFLAHELPKHDIYLTASEHEAGANHVLEAAACGLPILYHELGGSIPEYVAEFGIEFSNVESLKMGIIEMVKNYSFYKQRTLEYDEVLDRSIDGYCQIICQVT